MIRVPALALAFLGLAAPLMAAGADLPEVGRFDSRGRYQAPRAKAKFRRVHRQAGVVPQYPVVLVHGIFGFEKMRLGPFFGEYFVGVKKHLRKLGVDAHTVKTTSFESIAVRAAQLKEAILALGADKVNLVAHSMGGLDCRYLITHLGMADRVASLTTVSSPHHGSWYADFVQKWVFQKQRFWWVWDKLGIPRAAIPDVTVEYVSGEFNPTTPNMPGVRYFSLGGYQTPLLTPVGFSTGTVINNLMEKIAYGKKLKLRERLMARALFPKALRRELKQGPDAIRSLAGDTGWIDPEFVGRSDALITPSSARWGEYLGTLNADHLDQIGWFTSFDQKRLFRGICKMLVDAEL